MFSYVCYILKRILISVFTIFLSAILVFSGSRVLPGSPFRDKRKLSPEVIKNIEKQHGFDKPYYVQFFKMLRNIFTFNCLSLLDGHSLVEDIFFKDGNFFKGSFFQSLLISIMSTLMLFIFGILLGSLFASKNNFICKFIEKIVIFLNCLPAIIIANLTVYFFRVIMKIDIKNVVFISFIYMLPSLYNISEQTKNLIKDKLNTEYIKFLKLKGLNNKSIFFKHVLITSTIPLVSTFFSRIINAMASLTVIETAFSITGVAHALSSLILKREYDGILFLSVMFSVMNVVAKSIEDIILKKMDPTIKM